MPFRFRKNRTLNDKTVRDLIFKGYIVPFKVESENIKILGIYKNNIWQKIA